uniref:Brain protein I3 n=1 Tax=Caenorhabditis japonica TaxID=281687 RepID=A0A8R1HRI7_CAEJA
MDSKPSAPEYPAAPPAYTEATVVYPPIQMPAQAAATQQAPPHPHLQQQQQQPVYVVQQPQEIIILQTAKMAPSFDPYTEFCPRCQTNVMTRVERTMGFCSWTMLFLGLFVFFPLLCCFCLDGFKDSRHACPNCGTILSYKRR